MHPKIEMRGEEKMHPNNYCDCMASEKEHTCDDRQCKILNALVQTVNQLNVSILPGVNVMFSFEIWERRSN